MFKFLSLLLTLVLLGVNVAPAAAQTFVRLQPVFTSDTISANADLVELRSESVGGFGSVKIQTLDSYTGTWEVQCSVNGTTYDAAAELKMSAADSTSTVTSVSDEIGIWDVSNAGGCRAIRVIATAGFAATDTVVVISATQAGGGGGGGGGGGTVSVSDGTDTALVSAGGELQVSCGNCSGSGVSHVDDAAFTPASDDVVPLAGVFDDVTPDSVNEGDAGAARMSANRVLYGTVRDAAGNERGANVTAANELLVELGAGAASIGILGANSGVDIGDVTVNNATLAVTQSGTWDEIGINDSGNSITVDGTVTVTDGAGALNVIIDSSASLTVTDGAGAMNVICDSGCAGSGGTSIADDADFVAGTTVFTPVGGFYQSTVTACTDGDACTAGITSGRAVKVHFTDAAGASLTVASDMTVGTAYGTTAPGGIATYLDFDGAALPTATNVDTELEAVPIAASIKGVQYMMLVSEDGSLQYGTATTPMVVGDGTGALNVICDSGCSGGTQYAVDAALGATPTGTLTLAIRDDALSALTPVEGDAIGLRVDANGALWTINSGSVTVTDGAGALNTIVDSGTLTTVSTVTSLSQFAGNAINLGTGVLGTGTLRMTVATDDEINDDLDLIRIATETVENAVSGAGFNITQFAGATVPMTTTQADDLANTLDSLNVSGFLYGFDGTTWDRVLATAGAVHVTDGAGALNAIIDSGTVTTVSTVTTLSQFGGNAINLGAGAVGTGTLRMVIATDDPVNDYAVLMGANLVAHDAVDAGSPLKVGGYASTAVPTAVSAAGDRVNAWYTLNGAAVVAPGGGLAHYRTAAGTTEDEHEIKATAGTLYSILITNTNAAARYVRCYNLTAANTTPGTSTVFWGAAIPGAAAGAGFTYSFPAGLTFDTALTCAWTTGAADTDVAEVAANEIKATYTYR